MGIVRLLFRFETTIRIAGGSPDSQSIALELADVAEARRSAIRALCEMVYDFGPQGSATFTVRVIDPDGHLVYDAEADYREIAPATSEG